MRIKKETKEKRHLQTIERLEDRCSLPTRDIARVTKEIIDEAEKEWKGQVINKEGTAQSNGRMILINHNIHSEVVKWLEKIYYD